MTDTQMEYTLQIQRLSVGFRVSAYPTSAGDNKHRDYATWGAFRAAFRDDMDDAAAERLHTIVENASYGVEVFEDRRLVRDEVLNGLGFE